MTDLETNQVTPAAKNELAKRRSESEKPHSKKQRLAEAIVAIASEVNHMRIVDWNMRPESGHTILTMAKDVVIQVPYTYFKLGLSVKDITEMECEGIVLLVNKQLELGSKGISQTILTKGGSGIQLELNQVRKIIGGQLLPGSAVSTSAGNLPMKRIIYTTGPEPFSPSFTSILTKSVKSCLTEASKHKLKSLALPAIGCRGFGQTAVFCAQIVSTIVEFFKFNSDTSLSQICLVENSNEGTFKQLEIALRLAESDELEPRPKSPARKRIAPQDRVGPDIILETEDILLSDSDAIVASTTLNTLGNCTGSAITRALHKLLGTQYQTACSTAASLNPDIQPGDVIGTSAIPGIFSSIYHVILGDYDYSTGEAIIRKAIGQCLKKADEAEYDSIAFPCLGSGGFGFPSGRVIEWIYDEVGSFQAQSLNVVIVVILETEKDAMKAWMSLRETDVNAKVTRVIKSEIIQDLLPSEEDQLIALAKKQNVAIDKRKANALMLRGLKENVREIQKEAVAWLKHYNTTITCAKYYTWKYKDSDTYEWNRFDKRANYDLEKSYKENKKGSFTIEALLNGEFRTFEVNYRRMILSCPNVKTSRVRRVASNVDVIPENWEEMGEEEWTKVRLSSDEQEYKEVVSQFKKTLSIRVNTIERIQNPTLYKIFQVQKKRVVDRLIATGSHFPVTRRLFHGTAAETCDSICKENFDRGHAGINGTLFGIGVYFATTAAISDGFAKGSPKHVFLAEVITGQYFKGDKSMKVAPKQPDGSPYHSVVDDVTNPTKFVVFRDASVYPSYLVTYT